MAVLHALGAAASLRTLSWVLALGDGSLALCRQSLAPHPEPSSQRSHPFAATAEVTLPPLRTTKEGAGSLARICIPRFQEAFKRKQEDAGLP
jgi:hypothetical protein